MMSITCRKITSLLLVLVLVLGFATLTAQAASFSGVNKTTFNVSFKGIVVDIYINAVKARELTAYGTGASALTRFVPGIFGKLLGLAVGLTTARIAYANAKSRGVIITIAYKPLGLFDLFKPINLVTVTRIVSQ